jgi:hypothetical protein
MQTSQQHPITVTYKSGTHPTQGWDVMQVIYSQGGRALNSFVIARDAAGTIVRKIDSFPEQWEIINNADDLRGFQRCFEERDRLQTRVPPFSAKCPACDKSVTAFLVMGSLENLQKGEGEVKLAHCTNDPYEGDHTWILNDPQAKARLRRLVTDKEQGL